MNRILRPPVYGAAQGTGGIRSHVNPMSGATCGDCTNYRLASPSGDCVDGFVPPCFPLNEITTVSYDIETRFRVLATHIQEVVSWRRTRTSYPYAVRTGTLPAKPNDRPLCVEVV